MPTVYQLNTVNNLTPADQFPFYQNGTGYIKRVSTSILADFVAGQINVTDNKVTQYVTPAASSTIVIDDIQASIWLLCTPLAPISTVNIRFPPVSRVKDKTEILIVTTWGISSITLDPNGAQFAGPFSNIAANGFVTFRFDIITKTWYRVNAQGLT